MLEINYYTTVRFTKLATPQWRFWWQIFVRGSQRVGLKIDSLIAAHCVKV